MPTGSSARRRAEAGYTLAALIGLLTVLGIVLAAAVPHWVARVQRDKEAELIVRGWQYAEAIRVFQRRFSRLPNTLDELVEIEPRSIRRLWRNPFAEGDDTGWAVLMEVTAGRVVPVDPASGSILGGSPGAEASDVGEELVQSAAPAGAGFGAAVAGPIHGVRSMVRGEAYRRFFEQRDIGDWEFTVERLVAATGALAPSGLPRRADYESLSRPFPYPPPGGVAGSGANPALPGQGAAPPAAPEEEAPAGGADSDDEGVEE